MLLPNRPTSTLVTIAWIGSIPGFTPAMVGRQLPPDDDGNGGAADWVQTGFVTVAVAGGGPDPMLPVRRPVMQVDCWATLPGSNEPPWHVADRMAQAIIGATLDRTGFARPLAIAPNGVPYPSAAVQAASVVTEPRQMWDDPGDYARYQMDLHLQWITLGETIP